MFILLFDICLLINGSDIEPANTTECHCYVSNFSYECPIPTVLPDVNWLPVEFDNLTYICNGTYFINSYIVPDRFSVQLYTSDPEQNTGVNAGIENFHPPRSSTINLEDGFIIGLHHDDDDYIDEIYFLYVSDFTSVELDSSYYWFEMNQSFEGVSISSVLLDFITPTNTHYAFYSTRPDFVSLALRVEFRYKCENSIPFFRFPSMIKVNSNSEEAPSNTSLHFI